MQIKPTKALTFGQFFEKMLREKNISQRKASKMLGKQPPAINRMISDSVSPKLSSAIKALEPFGYSIAIVPSDAGIEALPDGSVFLCESRTGAGAEE